MILLYYLNMSFSGKRTKQMRTMLILACAFFPLVGLALDISNRYRSPRNPERSVRRSTDLIVLHTTEAPARSSLNKLSDRGEAHFCVTEEGQIYAIVDRDREAFHAGRSMWNGREDVDKYSIGIECVGYHDKPMPSVQIAAIRDLVAYLKTMYRVTDERVVCHSHVAYGAPNKWQRHRHRGRKRCGMLFAMPSMRRALGLKYRPAFDPDTRARRLVVGDAYLQKVLYGGVDTMVGKTGGGASSASTAKSGWFATLIKGVRSPTSPKAAAKKISAPKTEVKKASQTSAPKSVAELKTRGFVVKGTVSKKMSASKIAGKKWNSPDTYYVIRNKVFPGNTIDDAHLENGMVVWMRP